MIIAYQKTIRGSTLQMKLGLLSQKKEDEVRIMNIEQILMKLELNIAHFFKTLNFKFIVTQKIFSYKPYIFLH